MFDFENKPVKDWTLAECREYCKKNKFPSTFCENSNCLLKKIRLCGCSPVYMMNFNNAYIIPQFTPDEIAFCRLIKETYPWASYIARDESYLFSTKLKPTFTNGFTDNAGLHITINQNFFPQIKPLTYYAIDDIIKQGELE